MKGNPMNPTFQKTLTGQSRTHLIEESGNTPLPVPIHREALPDLLQLQKAAEENGFELQLISGFRSFEDQLSIWNRKVKGDIAVLDHRAQPMNIELLSEKELLFAILRWSALPGASRHHWGTDVDVFDALAKPKDYKIELIPEEVNTGGMFGPLHDWLDTRIQTRTSFGFFRPYSRDLGGVSPERWHLSYAPVSFDYLDAFTVDILKETIQESEILLKNTVLTHLEEIYQRFVLNITTMEGSNEHSIS